MVREREVRERKQEKKKRKGDAWRTRDPKRDARDTKSSSSSVS